MDKKIAIIGFDGLAGATQERIKRQLEELSTGALNIILVSEREPDISIDDIIKLRIENEPMNLKDLEPILNPEAIDKLEKSMKKTDRKEQFRQWRQDSKRKR